MDFEPTSLSCYLARAIFRPSIHVAGEKVHVNETVDTESGLLTRRRTLRDAWVTALDCSGTRRGAIRLTVPLSLGHIDCRPIKPGPLPERR